MEGGIERGCHFDDLSLEKYVIWTGVWFVCVCVAGRMCVCISTHVHVTSVIGSRCGAQSSASDLVEIWDQRGRSAC